jgi:hypothetical protein
MSFLRELRTTIIFFTMVLMGFAYAGQEAEKMPVPTHADAAIIIAKHTGLFDRYVSTDATLNECVSFLNKHGIYFGLLEVVSGEEFTLNDCARVMGQVELVFSGEAEYVAGKVKLPKNIDSWMDFCTMSQVDYVEGYKAIAQMLFLLRELEH